MIPISKILRFIALFRAVKNRAFNFAATILSGRPISVDWGDLKIINPSKIHIGRHFSAGRGLWLESVDCKGTLIIGDRVNLSDYVHVGCVNDIQIGNGVLIGSRVLISDHSHGLINSSGPHSLNLPPNERPIVSKGPVKIKDHVWIGDGVAILAGVTIEFGAVIGANAVVITDVPAGTVWAGIPARQIWPKIR